jgi:glycerate 2-kinase
MGAGPRLPAAASSILRAGLKAADPRLGVRRSLRFSKGSLVVAGERLPTRGRVAVLAVGKAALAMADETAAILGRRVSSGLVVTNAGGPVRGPMRVLEAGHPLPDARGLRAAAEAERLLAQLGKDDLALLLLSGGASALLPAPAPGLSLRQKARTTALLLKAGANIHELNAVRKHLSRFKGGGLARLAGPARVRALVLSDVVGDDLSTIASGPASPDPTTFADALEILARRGVLKRLPKAVRAHLQAGAAGRVAETPKPGDALFQRVAASIVGSNRLSLEASAREARRLGFRAEVLTSRLEGEAREVARVLVAVLRERVGAARPRFPVCLLAGGETTVTVRGPGFGGRNQEMAVAAVEPLAPFPRDALFASLATDGIDGRSDAAGGWVDRSTLGRAQRLGLAPPAYFLAQSDSRSFLGPVGGLIVTGPTGTNVMDLTALLAL